MSYTIQTQTLDNVERTTVYIVTGIGRSPDFLEYAHAQYPQLAQHNTAYTVAQNSDGTKTVRIWQTR